MKEYDILLRYDVREQDLDLTPDLEADLEKAAQTTCRLLDLEEERVEISVSFVNAEEIQTLNREYRQTDRVTDVLSFPTDFAVMPDGTLLLGDVVICMDKVLEQAKEFGHSDQREILYLFVHSLLHLAGYDHEEEEEKKEMREMEKQIMSEMGVYKNEE